MVFKNSWDGPSSRRRVAWNPYSTPFGNVKDGGFVGMPSVVVTIVAGSSPTTRLIHVFGTTMTNQLRYLTILLQPNGLPYPAVYNTNDTQASPQTDQLICNTAGGPVSAIAYQSNIYVFCTQIANGKTVVACWWRKVDGNGKWTQSAMPRITASVDSLTGGVSAVLVQADF